jgi:hypothetical protein
LEEVLKPLTEHWLMSFGLCIVGMTLMGSTGLVGVLSKVFSHPSKAHRLRAKGVL